MERNFHYIRHMRSILNTTFIIITAILLAPEWSLSQPRRITVYPNYAGTGEQTTLAFRDIRRPRVAVVLSGGGGRGLAHVGVLDVLEKNNVPIDMIVGTSIGAIIGGLYASGYTTEQLRTLVDTTDWNYVLSLTQDTDREQMFLSQKRTADKKQLTVRFDALTPVIPSAVSTGQRLTTFINQLTLQALYHPVRSFDDLKIPFRSVATDLVSGRKVVFESGNLSEALRASISVPLLYNTLKKDSMELTDGGLVSNIPVDVARAMGADIVIAVNTTSPMRTAEQLKNPWEVADQIISIMAQEANRRSLREATIVITPDLGNYPVGDFTNRSVALRQGALAAAQSISLIRDSLRSRERTLLEDSSPLSSFPFTVRALRTLVPLYDSAAAGRLLASIDPGSTVTSADVRNVLGGLYRSGWYSDIAADIVMDSGGTIIELRGDVNPLLHGVDVTGASYFTADELLGHFTHLIGRPYNVPELRSAEEQVLGLYRENGLSLARVRTSRFDDATGRLSMEIDEGTIRKIYLKGKTVSRDWVVWRELGFRDGSLFTVNSGKQALLNLYGTNLFEQVLMDVAYEEGRPTIIIQVDERPTEVSRLGFRADNERNLQPSIEFRNENVLGTATEFGLSFAGGLRNRRYVADFQANRVFNTYFTLNLDAFYDLKDIYTFGDNAAQSTRTRFVRSRTGEYRQVLYGVSFLLGQQVERFGTLSAEYRLEADEIIPISGTGYTADRFTVQSLTLSSTIDTRDRYPFPRNGSFTNFSWETATSSLKGVVGDVGYSKIYFEYSTSLSYQSFTLHPRIILGFGDETVPLSQQFSLGGEESFFGLREFDSRGRQLFITGAEFRTIFPFRIVWDTYLRVRYDLGSIWPQREDIRLKDFHHGIGLGISLDTPLGPANLSVGRSFYIRRDLLDQPFTLGPVVGYFSFGYPIL